MNNEEKTKQAWQTPEIIDMDLDKTQDGFMSSPNEWTMAGPKS